MAKKKLTLSIDENLISRAKIKAIEENITLSDAVAILLTAWIEGDISVGALKERNKSGK